MKVLRKTGKKRRREKVRRSKEDTRWKIDKMFYCLFSVPYDEVDQDSALVEMFGQVGAYKCKYIVAVGALAGLTVSMFGSMFPMPRIVYAMAQDGLIFR